VPDFLKGGPTDENARKIVPVLQGYLAEAQEARKGGLNPRDQKWEENLNLYWNRYDHTQKAAWQAAENLPEVPSFVDRFAASLKEALITGPTGFYTVDDPADAEGDIANAIKRATDCWLSMCGRNQTGTCLGFPSVFEEQCKMGALIAMCGVVTWKNDAGYGRVAVETVDPRNVWMDHTYRNLYRVRRVELDKHELKKMAQASDKSGESIWNLGGIDQMITSLEFEQQKNREDATGHGNQISSTRQPIVMDEYIGTVVDATGKVLAENALMVVGNNQFLIRGPEKNPFWHNKDWMVWAPLVTAPLSVYGRTYMEDFGNVATAFNNLTNLILDAVQMSALKAFVCVPSMLSDPGDLADGISPNKLFKLEEGFKAEEFLAAINLGTMPPDVFQIWSALKGELREAADINEVGLGQFAPKGRTSASEINQTQESSSAMIRSMAQTIEGRFLNPLLDLVWQTGLQHVKRSDYTIAAAMGQELFGALMARRKELIKRPITFQAHGISTLIQKGRMLKALLQLMQFLAQSPELLAAFMQQLDMEKFLKLLFNLSDIDMSKMVMSERERLMRQTAQSFQGAAQQAGGVGAQPTAPGMAEMGQLMGNMGIQRAA